MELEGRTGEEWRDSDRNGSEGVREGTEGRVKELELSLLHPPWTVFEFSGFAPARFVWESMANGYVSGIWCVWCSHSGERFPHHNFYFPDFRCKRFMFCDSIFPPAIHSSFSGCIFWMRLTRSSLSGWLCDHDYHWRAKWSCFSLFPFSHTDTRSQRSHSGNFENEKKSEFGKLNFHKPTFSHRVDVYIFLREMLEEILQVSSMQVKSSLCIS